MVDHEGWNLIWFNTMEIEPVKIKKNKTKTQITTTTKKKEEREKEKSERERTEKERLGKRQATLLRAGTREKE